MKLAETTYRVAAHGARALAPLAAAVSPKLAASLEGRRGAPAAMERWAADGRDAERLLLWLHGASAGELAGARPVLDALRKRRPELQIAVSFSSPSGERVAAACGADWWGYPPWESGRACRRSLHALRPDALVWAKSDVWPVLAAEADRAGVPLGLLNGTVRPGSARLGPVARRLLEFAYGRLDLAGAVSGEDLERLARLGVPRGALRVTGDAAFDLALARADRATAVPPRLPSSPPGVLRLVAGSTWPADEMLLLAAAAELAPDVPIELVLVPHEPTEEAVERIGTACRKRLGIEPRLWSREVEGREAPAGGDRTPGRSRLPPGAFAADAAPRDDASVPAPWVVDAVGVLAALYREGDVAWVGGGLGGSGLHSVVEPAAAGRPVLFGPRHERREAGRLLEAGAAVAVRPGAAAAALRGLATDAGRRAAMGRAARRVVEEGAGAVAGGLELCTSLLSRSPRRAPGSDRGRTRRDSR